jgi:hypothetical protein
MSDKPEKLHAADCGSFNIAKPGPCDCGFSKPIANTKAEELKGLIAKATNSDLSDGGRYFYDSCSDLCQCGHGDTGEYLHRADGKLIEWLWNHRHEIAKALEAR